MKKGIAKAEGSKEFIWTWEDLEGRWKKSQWENAHHHKQKSSVINITQQD